MPNPYQLTIVIEDTTGKQYADLQQPCSCGVPASRASIDDVRENCPGPPGPS